MGNKLTLLKRFQDAGISDDEIIFIFQNNSSGVKKIKREYFFYSKINPKQLFATLKFNDKFKLHTIVSGEELTSERAQLDFCEKVNEEIFGDHGYKIVPRTLFSNRPLKSVFSWNEKFRIRPITNMTQIGSGLAWMIQYTPQFENPHLGPPYPFILDVRIKKSSNSFIENDRVFKELDQYQWLLILLIPGIMGHSSISSSTPKWVILNQDDQIKYHLAFEGFNPHDSDIEHGEQFSKLELPEMPRLSEELNYYNHLWGSELEIYLPHNLEVYLKKFNSLDEKDKSNFIRATYWFNIGMRLYGQGGLSIIPFSTAIECLLPDPGTAKCESCGRTRDDGPTKLFSKFLKDHLDIPSNLESIKKNIYNNRSDFAHGKKMLHPDQGLFNILNDHMDEMATQSFVRRALVNWLEAKKLTD